jgi:alkylation response protein AidB-like acyl-CoA dehydrogenase
MNFDLSPEESGLAERVGALRIGTELPAVDALENVPDTEIARAFRAWFARLGQTGYLAAAVGRDRRKEQVALRAAQLKLARTSQTLLYAVEAALRPLACWITDLGTEEQRRELLPDLLAGRWLVSVALAEPRSGSAPSKLSTRIQPAGDGYLISGEKSTVSLAPFADWLAVFGELDAAPSGGRRAVGLIPRGAPGLSLGPPIITPGYGALRTSPVTLQEVRLPAGRLLVPTPGCDLTAELHAAQDAAATAAAAGILRLALEEAQRGAAIVRADGKPPAAHQAVRFALAEMLAVTQTAELLSFRAAAAKAKDDPEQAELALCAKVFASEAAGRVTEQALQILGAAGYRQGHPAERIARNARLGMIVGHPSEAARMEIADRVIARMVRS